MFATRALGHGYPAGFQTMPGNHESWLAALAFCDEHGEDGPDILAGNIEASWRSHNAAAAMHWTDIGQRLIHMHLAGARAWH
ncbi:hypothetical protein J2W22_002925 [Sphingomonas kyeonggiensis]|uniref:hypothetical protein n=1 Tax=Sphingomonas kyeonggiensis TaxID=1268553 RepID=UPI0027818F0F|nr:hypothetical protein [Sphingomonas kyeonggiensis]MDQ0250861.1 hypothetical protein [Sphingomonas kyeonggiensis]